MFPKEFLSRMEVLIVPEGLEAFLEAAKRPRAVALRLNTLKKLPTVTGGEPVFSMYATGLEAVEGTFQPTGCDYIIHALGDEKRAEYVSAFAEGGWAWAQTPRMDLENWLTVQNWDVYRHLWAGYERCYATEYSWLWRACGDRSLPVEAQVSVEFVIE